MPRLLLTADWHLTSRAVAAWIEAEYLFRLGPHAYGRKAQDRLIAAEEALRKACSGKKYLGNAAKALGVARPAAPFIGLPVPRGDRRKAVLVFGGRDYGDRKYLFKAMDRLHAKHRFTLVIVGGAKGADRLAEEWADARGVGKDVVPADWRTYGNAAGPIRNAEMVKRRPDLGVGFPGGRGTADMASKLERARVPVLWAEDLS